MYSKSDVHTQEHVGIIDYINLCWYLGSCVFRRQSISVALHGVGGVWYVSKWHPLHLIRRD